MAITSTESDGDRLLLAAARQGGWWLALLGAASLAGAAAQVLLPAAVGHAIDAILAGNATAGNPVGPLTACAILVAVIVGCGAVTDLATGVSGATATARLRRLLAGHVVAVGPGLLTSATANDKHHHEHTRKHGHEHQRQHRLQRRGHRQPRRRRRRRRGHRRPPACCWPPPR